jgi:hypothetical protein
VDHAFPHVHACIDSRGYRTFDETDRVVEQHFVVAHVHANWREASHVIARRPYEANRFSR